MTGQIVRCCQPLLESPLAATEAERLAGWFKALADPARLRLLSMIADRGEVCACDLVDPIGLSQPTVSHHLKVLGDAGLLLRRREGRWVHYRVDPDRLAILGEFLAAGTFARRPA